MVHWMRHHQPGVPGISPEVITGALEHVRSQTALAVSGPPMAVVELRVPRRLIEGAPFDVAAYLAVMEGALTLALVKSRESGGHRASLFSRANPLTRIQQRVRKLGRVLADERPGAVDTISRSLLDLMNEAAFAQVHLRDMLTAPRRMPSRDPGAVPEP